MFFCSAQLRPFFHLMSDLEIDNDVKGSTDIETIVRQIPVIRQVLKRRCGRDSMFGKTALARLQATRICKGCLSSARFRDAGRSSIGSRNQVNDHVYHLGLQRLWCHKGVEC